MKLEFSLIVGVMLVAFAVAKCPKNDTSKDESKSEENNNIKGNSKERMLEWFYPPAPESEEDDRECPANASCPRSSNPLRCGNGQSVKCPSGQICCRAYDFIGKCCVPAADSDESSTDSDESSTDSDESSTDSDESSTDSEESSTGSGERPTSSVKTT